MTLHVKDGGTWKETIDLQVKDAGSWKPVTNGYVKDAGSWKEFYNGTSSYDYYIQASQVTTGGTTSTVDLALNSNAATGETWTVTSTGSSPAGFYDSHSVSAVRDTFGTVTLTSGSKTASAGVRVLLNYTVSCAIDGLDTVEPITLQVTHQF